MWRISQQWRTVSYEWWFEGQTGSDGERRVEAAKDGTEQHEFPNAHVDGQAGQVVAQRGQLLICSQGAQVPQTLLGRVQASHRRRLDEPREDRLQRLLGKHVQDLDSVGERGKLWTLGEGNIFLCIS